MTRTEFCQTIPHGHVNTMADTVLVNASPEDLRAILRNMLASKTPGLVASFMKSTHARLQQKVVQSSTPVELVMAIGSDTPSPQLLEKLKSARMLFGSGLGFSSLAPLAEVVRSTVNQRWDVDGEVSRVLAMADADIAQAIQSCKEQLLDPSQFIDLAGAQRARTELLAALRESQQDTGRWEGEFAFERGLYSVLDLKL
ncbi:hypothetical protein MKEN_01003500 [Mycena kentingensis (nom. inval.)]|nr:hypothetical protein MKEN_01003500 [Mycena kentingensis (nom. inval.)]